MVGAFISVSVSPVSGFSQPSRRMLTTDWLMERLPAEAIAMMRCPGRMRTCSLRKVEMLATPALVRVSANMTRPSRTRMPQQYVMTLQRSRQAVRPYIPRQAATRQSFLNSGSAARLADKDLDRDDLAGPAVARTAQRRTPQRIDPDGDSHPSRARYIRYCSLIAPPRRLLSSMNWLMNSCIPCWKISSMRLLSSRARTARAWRWAGPWLP